MRKLFGGAAEDLCEPPDSFLMRHVHEGRSPKTSVKVYWQVSACPCGTFSAAQSAASKPQTSAQRKPRRQLLQKLLPKLFLTCS